MDTTTPQGSLFFTIVAGFAEFESSLISDRVKAGMARARAQGKQIGRPPLAASTQREIERLARSPAKPSIRSIHERTGASYATTWEIVTKSRGKHA